MAALWLGTAPARLLASESSLAAQANPTPPGAPFPLLAADHRTAFERGRVAFELEESPARGLGPLFNDLSCSRCHNRGGVGGAGFQSAILVGRAAPQGNFDALVEHGGPFIAQNSVKSLLSRDSSPSACTLRADGEPIPPLATVIARRRTTPLFGLGLVDATTEATFDALRQAQPPSTRGRIARPPSNLMGPPAPDRAPRAGRFGWKAQFATLLEFSASALRQEIGITNPLFPTEQVPAEGAQAMEPCDELSDPEDGGSHLQAITDFLLLLAPVTPLPKNASAAAGDRRFTELGCDQCHVRSITSGPHPVPALSEKEYHPYSDFLLHDFGERADGFGADGDAAPSEMRTAPLWGLRLQGFDRYLHDGRAHSLQAAILEHAGQAKTAADAFRALPPAAQADLVSFLQTL